ncbi:hypothetical protein B0H13DRAFT_2671253 [Mycena leptocephala]|nr:hypothetical protein B0H13DRAFT_2671253 [Mycena leptocephala]
MSSSAQHFVQFNSNFTLAVSILGAILSVLLLAAIAYLQWNPVSRPHIDRVSFRLVIYGLGANVVLGFMAFPSMKETTPGCSLLAFFGVTLSMLSASMFCCIALNLQLVLVYGVNGNMMEKYYVLGAVFLSAACATPPFAAGELGWYAMDGVCWLRDSTPAVQLHWLIGTQSVPMLLMSSIEVFSFVNILIFMIKIQHLRASTKTNNSSSSESRITTLASNRPKPPIVQYRVMIIRIALYPLLSCFLSITVCILDVYSITQRNLADADVHLRGLDVLIFCLRPLGYALLAVTDPSFIRAMRSVRQKSSAQSPAEGGSKINKACSTREDTSFQVDCEWGPSTAGEAAIQEELRSDSIAHQF